ncbi:MAG: hypothetical protein ACRD96_21070 [Bryobacteraceae bacterium]
MSAPIAGSLPYYVWQSPDRKTSIQLSFDVIDRILQDVMRGFGSLPRRGAEVGGILLGRGEPGQVIIEEFELVECEYQAGPSFVLSDRDRAGLAEALEKWSDKRLRVVGLYRSHTRKDLYLDDLDEALFRQFFGDPEQVFLVIKPFATRACVAGFCLWRDGELERDGTLAEFVFNRRELGGGDPRPVAARREAAPSESREQETAAAPAGRSTPSLSILSGPAAEAPPAKSGPGLWLWVPVALAIAVVGGIFGFVASKGGPEQGAVQVTSGLPLKLAVTQNGTQLDVRWDRQSQTIAGAQLGILSIQDGPNRKEIELSASQLQNGRVLYSRITSDVSLKLEVFGRERSSSAESVRVLAADAAPAPIGQPRPRAERPPPVIKPVARAPKREPAAPEAKPLEDAPAALASPVRRTTAAVPPPAPVEQPKPVETELVGPARRR